MSKVSFIDSSMAKSSVKFVIGKRMIIDDFAPDSNGYLIDFTKGDTSKNITFQCKIKVISCIHFEAKPKGIRSTSVYIDGIEDVVSKVIIEYFKKYGKNIEIGWFLHDGYYIFVICKKVSDWSVDLLSDPDIKRMLLLN